MQSGDGWQLGRGQSDRLVRTREDDRGAAKGVDGKRQEVGTSCGRELLIRTVLPARDASAMLH